jgi:hypothetical protein
MNFCFLLRATCLAYLIFIGEITRTVRREVQSEASPYMMFSNPHSTLLLCFLVYSTMPHQLCKLYCIEW